MQLERSKLTKLRCAFPFIAWIFQAWALSHGFVNKRLSIKIGWLNACLHSSRNSDCSKQSSTAHLDFGRGSRNCLDARGGLPSEVAGRLEGLGLRECLVLLLPLLHSSGASWIKHSALPVGELLIHAMRPSSS